MESKHAKGGRARAEKLSPEDRTRIARDAAAKRWAGHEAGVKGPKVVAVKFDPAFIARVDEVAALRGTDRATLLTLSFERAVGVPEPWWKAPTGGSVVPKGPIHVVGERPTEQTRPRSILDGLDIADAPRRPAPGSMLKKGK